MKELKSIIFCGLLCFVSTKALAVKTYNDVTIKDVIVTNTTGIHFRINEPMIDNESCGSNAWFKVESGSAYENAFLSILLAYEAQNKPIIVHITGCTGGYPKIHYIH